LATIAIYHTISEDAWPHLDLDEQFQPCLADVFNQSEEEPVAGEQMHDRKRPQLVALRLSSVNVHSVELWVTIQVQLLEDPLLNFPQRTMRRIRHHKQLHSQFVN
jgi:hypothetical protein